jgi:hypothetical protein
MTADLYGYLLPGADEQAAATLNDATVRQRAAASRGVRQSCGNWPDMSI